MAFPSTYRSAKYSRAIVSTDTIFRQGNRSRLRRGNASAAYRLFARVKNANGTIAAELFALPATMSVGRRYSECLQATQRVAACLPSIGNGESTTRRLCA